DAGNSLNLASMMRLTVTGARTQNRSMLPARSIPRVPAPSPDEFRRTYVKANRPVVLTGMIDDWPAFRTWSSDHLRSRFGETSVPVVPVVDGAIQLDARRGLVAKRTRFS